MKRFKETLLLLLYVLINAARESTVSKGLGTHCDLGHS